MINELKKLALWTIILPIATAAIMLLPLSVPVAWAASVGQPVRVSPAGHTVGEFSAATSPANPQVMAASAMDNDEPGHLRCAVYVSRDGGHAWSEVPAWPGDPTQQPFGDPWVTIGADGTIHASCVAKTSMGSRIVYTQSRDQGVTWSPIRTVTPFAGQFHRQSTDKDALTVDTNGTVYTCFNQALTSPVDARGLMVSRSSDQGVTWTTRDTGAVGGLCNGITVASGVVTVVFVAQDLRYGTVTSMDGGNTWGTPVMLGSISVVGDKFSMPTMVRDATGRTVIAEVAGATPRLDISIENAGALVQQWQLAAPNSDTCRNGRLIQPALTAAPTGLPAFQIACKVDPTSATAGRLEVWLYPSIDQPGTTPAPVQVTGFALPAGSGSNSQFAGQFPDGGDYWSATWMTGGWLSMWVDPRTGGGPGELTAAPVTN